jgi:hypothetical protein
MDEHLYDGCMFTDISASVDRAVKPGFVEAADVIVGLAAYDRFGALLADVLGEFDSAKGWDMDPYAATSLRSFLAGAGGRSGRDAGVWSADAKWLRKQPVVLAAARSGELSRGQVDAIHTNVPAALAELFAEHAPYVVPKLIGLSVAQTAAEMQQWREMAEAVVEVPEPAEKPNSVSVSSLLDGRGRIVADLDPLLFMLTKKILTELTAPYDPAISGAERTANAWGALVRFGLDHHETARGRRNRPHAHLVVDAASGLGTYIDGQPVPQSDLEMLLCDSTIQRVMVAEGVTIDLGHSVYSVSPAVWDTIAIRDQHCRFDDHCNAPISRCDAHHVTRYPDGPTNQFNLALLCGKHHHRLHKPGWHAELDSDAGFHVTDPTGHTWTTHAQGPSPAQQLKAKRDRRNAARAEAQRQRARDNARAHGPASPHDTPPLFTDTR